MEIVIIKKNHLISYDLPREVQGSYWISTFENGKKINLLNIEAVDGEWQVISNDSVFVVDQQNLMIPNVLLRYYSFYPIKDVARGETYYLYSSPVYESNNMELAFSDRNVLTVGSNNKCDISYKMPGISDELFSVVKSTNGFYLQFKSKESAVYLNKRRILQDCKIYYGDIIFVYGLKIVLLKKDGVDYLLVNNPGNALQYNASMVQAVPRENTFVDDFSVLNDDLSNQVDYFYRAPHFYRELNNYNVDIDSPPAKKTNQENPMILTIGPMLTMSITSIMMLLTQAQAVASGEKDLASTTPSMITAGVMLASCLLWPLLTRMYRNFSDKRYESKRQKKYKKYLDKKDDEIELEKENQKNALIDNYFSVEKCQEVIQEKGLLLWQRRITDSDFLTLPIGVGDLPMNVTINYPEEHFSLDEDNLLDMVHHLGQKKRILMDVPITYSFYQNYITGIVGDSVVTKKFIDNLILQMMTNYSYDELKIVTFPFLFYQPY